MGIFDRLFKTPGTGAEIDSRSRDEKEKDYSVREVFASAVAVNWREKKPEEWRSFPEQNQMSSSSCVAQTLKKVLGVQHLINSGSYVKFSAAHIYQNRSNKPGEGMIGVNAFEIARTKGVTLEELVPSDKMNEQEINSVPIQPHHVKVGEVFKITNHVGIPNADIDTVASVIQKTGKAVMVWFYFTSAEWSREVPVIKTPMTSPSDPRALRHSVTAVDFTLYKGQKALIIEDSAHFGGISRRIITEDFFKKRQWFARYPMNFVFQSSSSQDNNSSDVNYTFEQELAFIPLDDAGEISDLTKHKKQEADVKALQDILKAEGCLATNISSTGYYGSITSKAVMAFQTKHKVASEAEISALRGRFVGQKTISKLNELYSSK